ncbi:MAG: nucleotide sugar dehydrogenase [Patescibacteria group bacterium]
MINFLEKKLLAKISSRTLKIGIIGLGYVGLNLAIDFARNGYCIYGYDKDSTKVKKLKASISYISDISSAILNNIKDTCNWSNEISSLKLCNVFIICVPTNIDKNKQPVMSNIKSAGHELNKVLTIGSLVILQSTSYPGTTENFLMPIINRSGLKCSNEYFLAFSSERINPGNKAYTSKSTTRVVGGVCESSTNISVELLKTISPIHRVNSPKIAEFSKVLENSFRWINIGFINEMAILANSLNINIWEVIEAANTKPYGFMAFYPNAGTGGHCIPVDPYYLQWLAESNNYSSEYIRLAEVLDDKVKKKVLNSVESLCSINKEKVKKVLIVGMSYKSDINDLRESPSIQLAKCLLQKGYEVWFYDNFFDEIKIEFEGHNKHVYLKKADVLSLENFGVCVIMIRHKHIKDFEINKIIDHSSHVLDTKNYIAKSQSISKITNLF